MKKFALLLSLLSLFACKKDNIEENSQPNSVTHLISSIRYIDNPYNGGELLSRTDYEIDNTGKVISSTSIDVNNPTISYTSQYEYYSDGRLKCQKMNGIVVRNVVWNNNVASVFKNNRKITESTFSNNGLVTQVRGNFVRNNISTQTFRYDSNENLVSIADDNGIYVEFLNYDLAKNNPLHLLKSLLPFLDYYSYSKNIFYTKKVYPSNDEDSVSPMMFYQYHYTFDANGRVFEAHDDDSLIYIKKYEYR